MILPDVNILIYAVDPTAANHGRYRDWLDSVINGDGIYGMSPQVLSFVLRILTNRRAVRNPQPLEKVLAFANLLIDRPNCQIVQPGPGHWRIFSDLCRKTNARGDLVPDAWFAALAIESGCEWITLDRDFRRFDGLRVRTPF